MSKTKNKSRSEVEVLRGENRKLRSENKKLLRELKELSKRAHFYEEVVDEIVEEVTIKEKLCQDCGKGVLFELDLKYVKFLVCENCDERTKI